MVSGVIMNIVKDGQVEWLDRGILFSGGLFLWLLAASIIQWQFSQRGRGQSTAAMNIVSFVVVVAALAMVLSTPHGSNTIPDVKPISDQSESIEKDFR
jgi:peptidoglycan/LPS O-acetylase OafA/YrhL